MLLLSIAAATLSPLRTPLRAGLPPSRTAPPHLAAPPPAVQTQPLFAFSGAAIEDAIAKWERIDDVIMGGVSNSRLVSAPGGECAYFEGRLRELGGGFCGQRMRLLSSPLDLSSQAGVYLDCEADADAPRRA